MTLWFAPETLLTGPVARAANGGGSGAVSHDNVAPVGTLQGSVIPTKFGAAVYSLPLEMPPAARGLIPDLALTHSEDLGVGQYGVGWSIEGISVVKDCHHNDGVWGYCLDGMPLIELGQSTCNIASEIPCEEPVTMIEYRTYPDSSARITRFAWGSVAVLNDPETIRWRVELADGRVLDFFGEDPLSDLQVGGRAVGRISDVFGNFVLIDADWTQLRGVELTSIRFGGTADGEGKLLPEQNRVDFLPNVISMPGRFYWFRKLRYDPCGQGELCERGTNGSAEGSGAELLSSVTL